MSVVDFPRKGGALSIIPARALSDDRLTKSDVVLLAALGSYADRDGWCWPSATTLAKQLGVTRRRVQQVLRRLEDTGYVESVRRFGDAGMELSAKRRVLFGESEAEAVAKVVERAEGVRSISSQGSEAGLRTSAKDLGTSPAKDFFAQNVPKNAPIERSWLEAFEAFWKIYPSRSPHANPKKPAKAKFEAAVKRGVPVSDIQRGAENYARLVAAERTKPQYIAQAVTWLNQERWSDHIEAPPPAADTIAAKAGVTAFGVGG